MSDSPENYFVSVQSESGVAFFPHAYSAAGGEVAARYCARNVEDDGNVGAVTQVSATRHNGVDDDGLRTWSLTRSHVNRGAWVTHAS